MSAYAVQSWSLVGLAVLLLPATQPAPHDRNVHGSRRVSLRGLQLGAAFAVTAGAVVQFGLLRGAVVAAVVTPGVGLALVRLNSRTTRTVPTPGLALTLDLVAAALRAGQTVPAALALAAPAVGAPVGARLLSVGGLLRLGADPAEAWRVVADDPVLSSVAAAGRRSADSGIRLASAFEHLADELRAQLRAAAEARAHRAGVYAMAPLGLCFLPAFVCLGIAPVVVGIARGVMTGLP